MKKSLISAIKKLLAKLGAEEIEGNNLVEVIDSGAEAIAAQGGGGANVLSLYCKQVGNHLFAYKDTTCADGYTYEEAENAIKNADFIKIFIRQENGEFASPVFPYKTMISYNDESDYTVQVAYIEYNGNFASKTVFLAHMRQM